MLEKIVSEVLHNFGIPSSLKGYLYLRETVIKILLEGRGISLYFDIAKNNDTTNEKIERNIRYAIETGWKRLDLDICNKYFGNSYSFLKGKPTNVEFIFTIVDRIRMDYKWNE